MIDSERLDLESASSAYRRRRCPGSANLVRALREGGKIVPVPDKDAESGTRVHRAWSGERVPDLNPREADTLESLKRMEAMVVTDWAQGDPVVLLGREQRLWLHEHLEPIHSGAFDVAYGTITDGHVKTLPRMLIIDGKTLFGEVSPAEQNDQLRELVGLARANFSACAEFTVAILQPWVSQRPSVAVYDEPEAELALRELRATIFDSADPDAPRIAGVWCDKCPALALCDEPRRLTARAHDLAKKIQENAFTLPIGQSGSKFLDAARLALECLDAILARYKLLLASSPDCVPGWYLKPGRNVRKIPDLAGARKIAEGFMPGSDFETALNVSVTALVELCKKNSGLRGKALDDYFNQKFNEVIERTTEAPSLARRNDKTLS